MKNISYLRLFNNKGGFYVIPAPAFAGVNSSRNPDAVPAKAGNYPEEVDSRFHGKPWIPVFTGMTRLR